MPSRAVAVSRPGRLTFWGWLEGYRQGESLTHLTAPGSRRRGDGSFTEFRHMGEGADCRFEIILARSSARHLNQRLTDALANVAGDAKRRK